MYSGVYRLLSVTVNMETFTYSHTVKEKSLYTPLYVDIFQMYNGVCRLMSVTVNMKTNLKKK